MDPSCVADADPGRPIELYGVGFRNGYAAPLAIGAPSVAGTPGLRGERALLRGLRLLRPGGAQRLPLGTGRARSRGRRLEQRGAAPTAHRRRLRSHPLRRRPVHLGTGAGRPGPAGQLRRDGRRDLRVRGRHQRPGRPRLPARGPRRGRARLRGGVDARGRGAAGRAESGLLPDRVGGRRRTAPDGGDRRDAARAGCRRGAVRRRSGAPRAGAAPSARGRSARC